MGHFGKFREIVAARLRQIAKEHAGEDVPPTIRRALRGRAHDGAAPRSGGVRTRIIFPILSFFALRFWFRRRRD